MKNALIDGVPVVVETIDGETGLLGGRSLMLSHESLPPVKQVNGFENTGYDEVRVNGESYGPEEFEMLTGEWWPNQIQDWKEWKSLGDEARRAAVGRPTELFVGPEKTLQWSTDPTKLRAPFPPQLVYPTPSPDTPGPPFTGPRVARHWVDPLQASPGSITNSWTVDGIVGARETYASLTGVGPFGAEIMVPLWPTWNSRIDVSHDAIAVTANFKDIDRRGHHRDGAAAITWFVPAVAIAQIQVSTTWDNMIPMVGARKKSIGESVRRRGYGPMTGGQITLVYSDGWRVLSMSLLVGEKYAHDDRPLIMHQLGEQGFADLVDGILDVVNAAQQTSLVWERSTPEPISVDVAKSVRRDDDIHPTITDTMISDRAVHWAVPISSGQGASVPTSPESTQASLPPIPPPTTPVDPPPPQAGDAVPESFSEGGQLALAAGSAAGSCLGGLIMGAITLLFVAAVSVGVLLLLTAATSNPGWGLFGFFSVWAVFFLYRGVTDFQEATRQGRIAAQYGYRNERSSASWKQLEAVKTIVPGLMAAGLAFISILLATGAGT